MKEKAQKTAWKNKIKKISPLKKPEHLSLEDWQITLRQQIARDVSLRIKNVGSHPIFSTFEVTNPQTKKTYRAAIRGEALGINYCSCPDFSVNTLGTCKHIESVLRRLRKHPQVKEVLKAGHVSDHSSVTLRYGLKRRVFFSVGKKASEKLKALVSQYFDSETHLTARGFKKFDEFMKEANTLKEDIHYYDDALAFIAKVRDEDLRKKRIDTLFPQGIKSPQWKSLMKADLYPYQKEGVLFAAKAGRCLIADEMGLGKTIQAIATAEVMARALGVEKILIVCPSSLKHQWKQEIEKLADRSVQIIQGLWHRRQQEYQRPSFFKIVNYDVVHRDLTAISGWSPDLIILDEAQRVKNWKTRLAKSVKRLSSPYAIVLTGTPLENRLEELHSILEFIDQHHLGPLFRFLDRHQVTDEAGKVVGYRDLKGLNKTLETVLIRRTRKEVLSQLPDRMDKNYFVPMTPEQWQIHEENREMAARIISKWRKYHFLSDEDQQRLMRALQNMRMVCDNTYLVDERTVKGKKIDELEIQLREIFEDPQAKAVIFSQWLRMGELVAAMLNVNGWKYTYLHGGIPSTKRGDLIQVFKEDPACRVFLSTDAGGTGLNLQQASTVINLDLPWNPAVLEQRISRVYRLGQERAVRVINFIAEGTIEQGMLALHRFKQSMFSGVLEGTSNEVFMEGGRLNRFMKTVETATAAVPKQDQVQEILSKGIQQEKQRIREERASPASTQTGPFKTILETGISLLSQVLTSLNEGEKVSSKSGVPSRIQIEIDPETGQKVLRLPLPDEPTLTKLAQATSLVANLLRQ